MSEKEMVELKLRLPKAAMDLLRAVCKDPESYLVHSILDIIRADLGECLATPESLIEKFNLAPVFKDL
jgi:hypothetical protein